MGTELPVTGSLIDADNPWPGLAPFTEDQSAFFFGRDEEIRSLSRLMERKALTVLFGQSGLGKSSLLQAGVFPRLRAANFCPIYIRLDHGEGAPSPTEQVKTVVHEASARAGTWTKPGADQPGETLWEFFHHRDDRLVSADGRTIVPVLVFDQFEELFTLGASAPGALRDRAGAFMSELAELVENRPSEKLVARLDQSADEMDAFDFSRTDYRVCISLREDYLPHLEGLKTLMPALMENRMRLTRMTGTQALDAVIKPGGSLVSEDIARAIVEFVSGARGGSPERLAEVEVEPPLLSVICHELNERRRKLGQPQITADLVSGNRREILTDFYERSVADLPEAMRRFVEDKLLTKSGFRDNLALETALEEPGVTRPLIDTLVARRLLRIEDRIGTQRVELTHDVLAEVIRTSRDTRQQREAIAQAQQRESLARRRLWLARAAAAVLLIVSAGVSWIAWRAIGAERREAGLRARAEAQELVARRKAYASDLNALQEAMRNENFARMQLLLNRQRPQPGQEDLRGWEWRFLWQFCQSDVQAIVGQAGQAGDSLARLSASADGRWVAVGPLGTGQPTLFDLQTKEVVRPAGINGSRLAFSPREPLLAVGGGRLLVLWNVETRQTVRTISLAAGFQLGGIFFSDDGQTVATPLFPTARGEGEIVLWNVATGERQGGCPMNNPEAPRFSNLAVSRDLKRAAYTTFADAKVHVVDLAAGKELWSARSALERNLALSFSPDGKMLVSSGGYDESALRLWDAATGADLGRLEGHTRFSSQLVFTPDGKTLASASGDHTIRIWDVATRQLKRTLHGHKLEVWALALLPDNQTLVSAAKDGEVIRWDMTAAPAAQAITTFPAQVVAWRFLEDGRAIVSVDQRGRITERRGAGFAEEKLRFALPPGRDQAAVLSNDSPHVAYVTTDRTLEVWDWERGVRVCSIAGSAADPAGPQSFAAKGQKLFVLRATRDAATVEEYEVASGKRLRSWPGGPSARMRWLSRMTLSPDEKRALWPEGFSEIARFDFARNREERLPVDVRNNASLGGFSPDGSLFAMSTEYGLVQVVGVDPLRRVTTLSGFIGGMHSAAFSPDGTRLAAGSGGAEAMMLWDVTTFERLLTIRSPGSLYYMTTFSPDGNVIGARSGTGLGGAAMHFWRAPTWAEIEKAEAAADPGSGRR